VIISRRQYHLGAAVAIAGMLGGCTSRRLAFPDSPMVRSASLITYDATHDGIPDFSVRSGPSGRLDVLGYDDDQDGDDDRTFALSAYQTDAVPHLIILLDSVPYQAVADRVAHDHWSWFDPPQKVIPPFPTMSGLIFSCMLHAPPPSGMINQHYDREAGVHRNRLLARTWGHKNAWERPLHYRMSYWQNGLAFLNPRKWFRIELANVQRAFDENPERVTIAYLASTSGMLSRHGAEGLDEVLDGLEQLCMSVLYRSDGAAKISVISDHGHNLTRGNRIDLPRMVKEAGFVVRGRLEGPRDVVIEMDGLVNYAGLYTRSAAGLSDALIAHPEIELAIYLDGDRVVIRSADGSAVVEHRAGRLRYAAIDADVLGYGAVLDELQAAKLLDADGFAPDGAWFDATIDHRWPDGPRRLWDAFHGLAVNTPDVMITTTPGSFVGLPSMEWFITMASTHGGLDQTDSAAFVLSMTGRATQPVRTSQAVRIIEPSFDPRYEPN